MKYYWQRRSARQMAVEKRFKDLPTLSQMRKEIKQNPRRFSAIPFRKKRFYGYKDWIEHKLGDNKIFNFGHLYFLGTQEEYDKL